MDERLKQQLALGREHYQKREFDKAEPILREVLEQQEGFADVHNMLGVIAHERSDFARAEKHLERATELNPNYTEALLNLAVTYNDQSKYEAGRAVYKRIRTARERSTDNLDPFVRGCGVAKRRDPRAGARGVDVSVVRGSADEARDAAPGFGGPAEGAYALRGGSQREPAVPAGPADARRDLACAQ
jgi:tetratricopeptide (TPR) repeat protein